MIQIGSMLFKDNDSNSFVLKGSITFDNAAQIAAAGEKTLVDALAENPAVQWRINLSHITLADSSALSVFLTWIRCAERSGISLCYTNIPPQLEALAKVSDIYDIIIATD